MEAHLGLFTEVYPIQRSRLGRLFAYRLDIDGGDPSIIGGKLSYRLRRVFPGHWVWTSNRVVTDTKKTQDEVMMVIEDLWREQPDIFKDLRKAIEDTSWKPTPQVLSEFVARGLFADIDPEIRKILRKKMQNLGNAYVERVYETRGWVVQGEPAISISIFSHLIHKQDLSEYLKRLPKAGDLIGLWARDKTSTLKGEITEISGQVGENRKRLLALTQREEMQEIIENAPDDELVVRVMSGRSGYEYVVAALGLIIRMQDLLRFGIDPKRALKALRMEPAFRAQLVKDVSELAKSENLVTDAFSSGDYRDLFITCGDVGFQPSLRFGDHKIRPYDEKAVLRNLRESGLYRRSENFPPNFPVVVGIVNALNVSIDPFCSKLRRELQQLGFGASFIHGERLGGVSRFDLEKAVESLQAKNPHALLAFLPHEDDEDEDEWGAYHDFKSLTIGRGIPSQVVYETTLDKDYAIANIVLGILAKTGNVPFVLGEPLSYCDLVVGIDIARERKKRLAGSISATAIARIYFSSGEFLRYVIHDAPLEGETVPENVLEALFPIREFQGKRVVIHRDGYFRGEEKQALTGWAKKIGAKFHLVEVLKTGTPRIYGMHAERIQQPPKGSVFKLSETEAFLVSSLPPFADATPQPLRIRTEPSLAIEQAIHSILSLTVLHYGSLRPPKLPVTIHYSDRIAYLALRGIKPKDLEGNIPFWL